MLLNCPVFILKSWSFAINNHFHPVLTVSANWHFSWPLLPQIGRHANCSSRLIHIFFTENVLRLHGGQVGAFSPQQLQSIIQPPLLSRGNCNQSFLHSLHEGAASFLFVLLWYVDLLRLLLLGVGDVAVLHLTINQLTSSNWNHPSCNGFQ